MKLAIIGSRTFLDYGLMVKSIKESFKLKDIELIISGGANGADKLAEQFADEFEIELKIFYPDWEKYGKSAGFIRNNLIISECDSVIAFWDGKSRGTKHSLDVAKRLNKNIEIINFKKR